MPRPSCARGWVNAENGTQGWQLDRTGPLRNVESMQAYSMGRQNHVVAGNYTAAGPMLQRAIQLTPNLASLMRNWETNTTFVGEGIRRRREHHGAVRSTGRTVRNAKSFLHRGHTITKL